MTTGFLLKVYGPYANSTLQNIVHINQKLQIKPDGDRLPLWISHESSPPHIFRADTAMVVNKQELIGVYFTTITALKVKSLRDNYNNQSER